MRFKTLATIVVSLTGLAAAQSHSQSWESWSSSSLASASASVPVTTTITKTLLHYNQTVTSTSYSATSTGLIHAPANSTSIKSTITGSSAPIATFSAGAAAVQEVNLAIAAVAGLGAVAYGLY